MLSTSIKYCCVTMDHRDDLVSLTHYFSFLVLFFFFPTVAIVAFKMLDCFNNCGHEFLKFVR